ncbi:MAG: amino acid ABC transporter ATP-binding protein [Desulfobulbaceae bacterium]|nr:amino acid ABC transporter ATP-binding protein [Desulfobulbaceae bacterium]
MTDMDKPENKPTQSPAIEVTGLNKWFDDFHVLKDVSIAVEEKEIIVICGPSGSGKSTFIRCINHLEKYQEGKISIFGQSLEDGKSAANIIRNNVGMLFQNFNLFPHLNILKNCTLGPIWLRNMPELTAIDQSMALLEKVGIAHLADKFPGQISGGQQQRVAIARSLAMNPKIMLLDEPTSALDPEMILEVMEVMIDMAKSGMTMMCVTHEMQFAQEVADRVIFMSEGEIVEMGSPDQVLKNPKWDRTSQFLEHILSHKT